MKRIPAFLIGLFCTLNLLAQTEPCDSAILNTEFAMIQHNEAELMAVIEAIKKLGSCGLEEADLELLLEGPMLSSIMMAIVKDGKIKLIEFIEFFNGIRNSEGYLAIRDNLLFKKRISTRIANLENWAADKLVFKSMGAPDRHLDEMEGWIKASDGTLTYKELVEKNSQK